MDNQEISIEKWVNLEDIAEYLSVSKDTIRSWMKENKIPFYRAGKRYKFKISEVDEWVRNGRITEQMSEDIYDAKVNICYYQNNIK